MEELKRREPLVVVLSDPSDLARLLNQVGEVISEVGRLRCQAVTGPDAAYWMSQLTKCKSQLRNIRWFLGV